MIALVFFAPLFDSFLLDFQGAEDIAGNESCNVTWCDSVSVLLHHSKEVTLKKSLQRSRSKEVTPNKSLQRSHSKEVTYCGLRRHYAVMKSSESLL